MLGRVVALKGKLEMMARNTRLLVAINGENIEERWVYNIHSRTMALPSKRNGRLT